MVYAFVFVYGGDHDREHRGENVLGQVLCLGSGIAVLGAGEIMDTLGFEPRAFRMRSGCDTTTPCAQ